MVLSLAGPGGLEDGGDGDGWGGGGGVAPTAHANVGARLDHIAVMRLLALCYATSVFLCTWSFQKIISEFQNFRIQTY